MNTFLIFFSTIKCLAIFIPPLVDPVLPPANIKRNRNRIAERGQRIKSAEANPVHVIIDMT